MEVSPAVLTVVVSVLAVAFAAYAIFVSKSSLSAASVVAALEEGVVDAQELADVALTAVSAAEQLWRGGHIQKDARLDNAFEYIRSWYPDVDQDAIIMALESAVLVVNGIVANLPEKK